MRVSAEKTVNGITCSIKSVTIDPSKYFMGTTCVAKITTPSGDSLTCKSFFDQPEVGSLDELGFAHHFVSHYFTIDDDVVNGVMEIRVGLFERALTIYVDTEQGKIDFFRVDDGFHDNDTKIMFPRKYRQYR
jgi:hypothetical protein